MKYVIAYSVPAYVRQVIAASYNRVTGRELLTENMHISLTYPFLIHSTHSESWITEKLNGYEFESIDSWLTRVDVFEQKKRLLYIKVEPYEDYFSMHLTINRVLRSGIQIDTKPFVGGNLPVYIPHIGLDYDFDGDHLTLHSLRVEKIEAWFDSGQPRLYKFDNNLFEEIF